jgi:hypothetical protein
VLRHSPVPSKRQLFYRVKLEIGDDCDENVVKKRSDVNRPGR